MKNINNTKQISLLGCGWLGFPLAQKLIENGFKIKGSTTSESKLEILESNQIQAFLIDLLEDKINGETEEFLSNSEILIIDIPPKLRGLVKENFVRKIKNLIPFIEKSTIEKVIFISSTSVYGDTDSISTLTEESELQPNTESGKQLAEVENILRNNTNFQSIIIRFGGLIGTDRNAVKMLTGKTNIANPEAPINLIHQEDCIGILLEIMKQVQNDKMWNETYNAVSSYHPTRKIYYTEKALSLNLPIPVFNETEISIGKIISSKKLEKTLGYNFKNLELG